MSRQPIELTAKKWKLRRMLGLLLFILGWPVVILSAAMIGGQRPVPMILQAPMLVGFAMIGGGMLVYIHARLMAWWHHG